MKDNQNETPSVDQALNELQKPVGLDREKFVAPVREALGKNQYNAEIIAGQLSDAVTEVRELSQELVLAKKTELIPDGEKANEFFNDGDFRQFRDKTIHEAESLMGRPIFGREGYMATEPLLDQSMWRDFFVIEVYGDQSAKQDMERNWKEKLDEVPQETRKQLCELYRVAFAENVVHANDGSVKEAGITAASSSLLKINEYLAVAPISRQLSFDIANEILITADGALSAVARGHFAEK